MNIVEVDIWYLTGHTLGIMPLRYRMTVRFQDKGSALTKMGKKIKSLRARELDLYRTPTPSGMSRFFYRLRLYQTTNNITRLLVRFDKRCEKLLRRTLHSSREVRVLRRDEYDTSTFVPVSASGRYEVLDILNDIRRLFDNDWVHLQTRIFGPDSRLIVAGI